MPGPSKRLEAGQQHELVGAAAARLAGGVSAVWRRRGEFDGTIKRCCSFTGAPVRSFESRCANVRRNE